jgi:NitT/TauT family transport system permease protein
MTERLARSSGGTAVLGVVGLALVVAVWQVVAALEVFGTTISTPTSVVDQLADPARRTVLVDAGLVTAQEAVSGFLIGVAAAMVIGLVVVLVPVLRRGVDQLATIESAIPFVALAPILLATVERAHVATAMSACTAFFPVYVAVVSGLQSVSPAVADVFTVFGSSRRQRLLRALVPSGVPVLATGLKVAMPLAIVGAVIGEWFGASSGLGPVILVAMRNYQMPTMWAAVTVTVLVALVLYGITALLEKLAVARFS